MNNVEYGNYYPYGLHEFPISDHSGNNLKNVNWATKNIITLPNHPNLLDDDIYFITELLNEI